jgi:hypothetical protein
MSQDLRSLERDVEQARSRLVGDLARLRSPTTVARFKDDAWEEVRSVKDTAVAKAQHTVMDGVHRLAADLKARAAANPAAALAIGAGVAWRLLRHPPIASALVGIGAYSLLRTDPAERPSEIVTRAAELTDAARERLGEAKERLGDAKERLGEWTDLARSKVSHALEHGASIAGNGAERGSHAAGAALETVQDTVQDTMHTMREAGEQVRVKAVHMAEDARRVASDQETRDTALLGVAALAIAAAAGIAYQRRRELS